MHTRTPIVTLALLILLMPLLMGQGLVQIDHTKEPPNAHVRPSRMLFNEIFVCRAESPTQWVGVSNYFTRYDPWIVVVVRVEPQQKPSPEFVSVDLTNPQNEIVINDQIRINRSADHALFYRTDRLLHRGGYGEWIATLSVEGVMREAFKFTIAREPWQPPQETDPEVVRRETPPFTVNLPIRKKSSVVENKISDMLLNLKRYF